MPCREYKEKTTRKCNRLLIVMKYQSIELIIYIIMTTFHALTYNMSFATQINKAIGSESDFVDVCQKHYKDGGFSCTAKAVQNIGKLPTIDIVGIQEVNSDIEKDIMKVQPNLSNYQRGDC